MRTPLILILAALLSLPGGGPAARAAEGDPLFTAFQSVKDAYKAKRYEAADAALKRLLELLASPERSAERERILPAYHFYSAAVAWQLKDEARAAEQLQRYFEYQPGASLDPDAYPKKYRTYFEAQRSEAQERAASRANAPGPGSIGGGTLPDYATQGVDDLAVPENDGAPGWVDGAAGALLTDAEKREYRSLPDDLGRREWVVRFWERLDPTPQSPENEWKLEFYRRVQYCEAAFSTEEVRGSLSERGRVFLLLGPPTFATRSALKHSQDPMDILRARNRVYVTPGGANGQLESWVYRRARIPKGIPYTELVYQFVTQTGYGTAVLQKEPRELTALNMALALLRKEAASE